MRDLHERLIPDLPRRPIHHWGAAAVLAVSAFAAPTPAAIAQIAPEFAVLIDPDASPENRRAAARRLIELAGADAIEALSDALAPEAPPEIRSAVLAEIAGCTAPPPEITDALATLLETTAPDEHPKVFVALSSIRTPRSARLLINALSTSSREATRLAIAEALLRLTGRDLGADAEAWSEWFAPLEFAPRADWDRAIAAGLARRVDDLDALRRAAISRLITELRDRFLRAEDPERRQELLLALLSDRLPDVRRLGLDLVRREVVNARLPGPVVVDRVLALLRDPDPAVRASAAPLVASLAPADPSSRIAEALVGERDPEIAAFLLELAARWPSVASAEPSIEWFLSDPDSAGMKRARAAAIASIRAHAEAGVLVDGPRVELVVSRLRASPLEQSSPEALRTLALVGAPADRARIAALLAEPDEEVRRAASAALSSYPAFARSLIVAAEQDPSLLPDAARAVAASPDAPDLIEEVANLTAAPVEARRIAVSTIAPALTPAQALAAARACEEPLIAMAILQPAAAAPLFAPPADDTDDAAPVLVRDVARARLELARAYLETARPDEALALLASLDAALGSLDLADIRRLRLRALVLLARIDEARTLAAGVDDWFDAAEALTDPVVIAAAVDHIRATFDDGLDEVGRARLDALAARVPAPEPAAEEPAPNAETAADGAETPPEEQRPQAPAEGDESAGV